MGESLQITDQHILFLAFTVICAPLLAFFISLLARKVAGFVSICSISLSFISSVIIFFKVWGKGALHYATPWLSFPNFKIDLGFLINDLTVLMLLLISLIALLVHIYSVEYMRKDKLKPRYFAYLSLFCFSMLSLVLADNLFLVYVCWELVGFSSYLLIGFWFTRDPAVQANKKAFIMNRVGDLGFLFGLMILISQFHTLDIDAIFGSGNLIESSFISNGIWVSPFGNMSDYWLTIAGLSFFAGAIAKSAQFPLHTWLPDAMEGPTAVSSLIHAATMVAAGVFLLVRIEPLFNPVVLDIIAIIGLFTAFMAATIAVTQTDIKKVLAFSTISQLGFMMLAIGVGDSAAAIFHLVTHAFFKCLLFLGAGIVIHELHHLKEKNNLAFDEQDMSFMGGLMKMMPITAIVFLIASMALSGLPFTSGYLSKDAILLSVFEWANVKGGIFWIFPLLVSITSWLTTFYIFRVFFKVFLGKFKLSEILNIKIGDVILHEPVSWLKYPVMILALFCIGFFFAINPLSVEDSWIYHQFIKEEHTSGLLNIIIPVYINVMSLILIYFAYIVYAKKSVVLNLENSWLYKLSINQWWFNDLYHNVFVKPLIYKSKAIFWIDKNVVDGLVGISATTIANISKISSWFDSHIIDGVVNGVALIINRIGIWFRSVQNGKLQHYVIWMLLVFITFFIFQMVL